MQASNREFTPGNCLRNESLMLSCMALRFKGCSEYKWSISFLFAGNAETFGVGLCYVEDGENRRPAACENTQLLFRRESGKTENKPGLGFR